MISDRGAQFQEEYRAWCKKRGVKPRFGAIGKHGSIAIIERFILSVKRELLWKIFVPASGARMVVALAAYQHWYNDHRPSQALNGRTPAEVRDGIVPARERVRFEPRARLPLARGDPNVRRCGRLALQASYIEGYRELPVIELREAA